MSEEFVRVHHMAPYLLGDIAQAVLAARQSGRDIVDLSQFNPSIGMPAGAVDALVQASLRPHNHRYSSSQGITKLREAMARWYHDRYGVELDSDEEVVMTMGTKEGLGHLLLAILQPGENILLPVPSYPIHNAAAFIAGAGCIGVPLWTDPATRRTTLDGRSTEFFANLRAAIASTWPRPRILICNFPHNPSTTIVTKEFFEELVELARDERMYIIHDFAYSDLCFDDYRAPSILEIPGAKDVAVEFYSFSKGLGMPGWRLGACVGNPLLVGALKKIKSYLDTGLFQPLQIAAIRALEQAAELTSETVEIYRARREVLCEGLAGIGWSVERPQATVFVWARIPQEFSHLDGRSFSQLLLDEANVAVCPGEGFGPLGAGWVRFALVESESRLRQAIGNLQQAFQSARERFVV